jgi:hypothetical protein
MSEGGVTPLDDLEAILSLPEALDIVLWSVFFPVRLGAAARKIC